MNDVPDPKAAFTSRTGEEARVFGESALLLLPLELKVWISWPVSWLQMRKD